MAEEKQLTVAELLARNAAERSGSRESSEGSDSSGSRRRRRRSLDEGGVSVAELTGNFKRVDATPSVSRHSSVSIDEPAPVIPAPKAPEQEHKPDDAAPVEQAPAAQAPAEPAAPAESAEPAQPSDEKTAVIERVKDEPTEHATDADKPQADRDETGEISVVAASAAAATGVGTAVPLGQEADTSSFGAVQRDDADAEEEDDKLNPVAIIVLAVLGVVLGAVVFKGFEILWDRFDRVLVAVLAVAVTAAMVGVVHAMRTTRDGFSMAIAALAGLVLTFGPLLLVMS